MDLSVFIPVYSKYDQLNEKLGSLNAYLTLKGLDCEVILIDNTNPGSLNNIVTHNGLIKIIRSENGTSQQSSYMRGFEASKGDWVLLLDYDLIERNELIDQVISSRDNEFDVIRTIRKTRRYKSFLRRVGSKAANVMLNLFLRNKINDIGSSLSMYKKEYYKSALDKKYERFQAFPLFVLLVKPAKIREILIDSAKDNINSEYSLIKLTLLFLKIVKLKLNTLFFRN